MTILEYRNIFKRKSANLDERLFDKLPGTNLDYPASFFWLHREHREALSRKLDALRESNTCSVCFESQWRARRKSS